MSYESLCRQHPLKPINTTDDYEQAKEMYTLLFKRAQAAEEAEQDDSEYSEHDGPSADDEAYLEVLALLLDAYELENGIVADDPVSVEEYQEVFDDMIQTARDELEDEEYQGLLRDLSVRLSTAMYSE